MGDGPSPRPGNKGTAQVSVPELGGGGQELSGASKPGPSGVLPTVFPGPFWRPVGDGSGRMEKVDHFPGLRPRLRLAHSVKTNPGVNVPVPA